MGNHGPPDLLPLGHDDLVGLRIHDVELGLAPCEPRGDIPENLLCVQSDVLHAVEGFQDLLVGLQAQRPQEDGPQEFSFAVNAHVEDVLGVVLELHPTSPVRDGLGHEHRPVVVGLEEYSRRPVKLAHDDPFGAVDDEGAVVGEEGDLSEIDFLLFDVPDLLVARGGVLLKDFQADLDLEGDRVGHPPFLALLHVVLELEGDGISADVADSDAILVHVPTVRAEDAEDLGVLDGDLLPALSAGHAEVL